MAALFVSDLHLDGARPATVELFIGFVEGRARRSESLYILGDLFEAWIGDDADEPGLRPVVDALRGLSAAGVTCYLMHGNRDFLLGEAFCAATGCRLLGDYARVDVDGQSILLTHGDLLCSDDLDYLALRETVRDKDWQSAFLAKPVAERRTIADELRRRSRSEMARKADEIMDVNQDTVEATMRRFGVHYLLHGHTHRPGVHRFTLDGRDATRVVLGAWEARGNAVRWDANGFERLSVPEA